MKLSRLRPPKPVEATGWKPQHGWMMIVGRGQGEARQKLVRYYKTIEEARLGGETLLRSGWEWGWVKEEPAYRGSSRII